MESLRKYIQLENSINLGTVDTKKEPPQHIKDIFLALKGEIEDKVHEKSNLKRGKKVEQKKEVSLYLVGGALSELFIKGYKGKPKDYNFYVVNEPYVEIVQEDGITVYGNMRDIVTDAYKEEINFGTIKMEKYINNENIKITIDFIQDNNEVFDLAFRGFYYKGETILASVKAIRDIENNQITINSLDTPLVTYYRLKEFEERYNMTAAPVEKYILLKYLEGKNRMADHHLYIRENFKYYTEQREKDYHEETNENSLERDIYSYVLKDSLNKETGYIPEILEKARIMYEQGIKEEELIEPFEIEIPEWDPDEINSYLYESVKHKMAEIIKKYNVKNKLETLYSEPKRLRYSQGRWLKGEITKELIEELKETINLCTVIEKGENTKLFYEKIIEKLRFKLFLDNEFLPEQKIVSTEVKESRNFGSQKNALEIEEKGLIELSVKPGSLYSKGFSIKDDEDEDSFSEEVCLTISGRGILIKYLLSGEFIFDRNTGFLDKKRKKVIERELKIHLRNWNKN